MSFVPLSETNIATSLFGVGAQPRIIDESLYEKRIHGPSERQGGNIHLLLVIIISAIIFVTVVSIYDVIRSALNSYYSNKALTDPNSHNSQEDINRTNIADFNSLMSTIVFASICIVIAIIFIPVIFYLLKTYG